MQILTNQLLTVLTIGHDASNFIQKASEGLNKHTLIKRYQWNFYGATCLAKCYRILYQYTKRLVYLIDKCLEKL